MQNEKSNKSQVKKVYSSPAVREWGTIADLTKGGDFDGWGDGKIGSIWHCCPSRQ